tara:strand:+ start:1171 stop:1353 length:183 start_codon:yes stop_codon:yes gene_type:complete
MIIIVFARKKIQIIIAITHITVGTKLVNPFVVLRNPLEIIPNIIANSKYKYPRIFVINYL